MQLSKLKKESVWKLIINIGGPLLIAFVITIVQAEFNPKNFNWANFFMNFILGSYVKTSSSKIRFDQEKSEPYIKDMLNTIDSDKAILFTEQLIDRFNWRLELDNKIAKVNAYINKLSRKKLNKKNSVFITETKTKAYKLKDCYIKRDLENASKIEQELDFNSLKIRYNHMTYSYLFTYGASEKSSENEDKRNFNYSKELIDRLGFGMISSFIFSYLFATLTSSGISNIRESLIQFGGYLFIVLLSTRTGIKVGEAIGKSYSQSVNSISAYIREVLKDIRQTKNQD